MLIDYTNGQTSVVLRVKLRNSSVTTGAGLTGLTGSSSGLIISTIADNEAAATAYTAAASHIQTIAALGTYAAPGASECRFAEVDSTNHPGIYELQIANARFAVASSKSLLISLSGATNLAQCDVVVPLRAVDPYGAVFGAVNTSQFGGHAVILDGNNYPGVNVVDVAGSAASAVSGAINANVTEWSGTAVASPNVAGVPLIDVGYLKGTTSAGAAGKVALDGSIVLATARALDSIADTSLTWNDVAHCAIASAAGKETVSGTTYTVKTPSTGTTLRTFTLDSGSAPTTRS